MKNTLINGKWELILPDHRAARPEWPVWEMERLEAMHMAVTGLADMFKMTLQFDRKPVVLDIGAEEGDFPALYSKWGADVILFEPNDRVWPNIKAIWEANNLDRPLGCFSGFASSKTDLKGKDYTELALCWPPSADGELIRDHGFKELADPGEIPETTVDDYLRWVMRTVDVITMDVEGSEFEALKGAAETIKSFKPVIFVSIHPESMFHYFKQYTAELVKFVADLGYTHDVLAFDHEFHFIFTPINPIK